ncbi:MAG: hypothetical protein HYV09_24950 [Deltaproteobacteria bacterium]|nr:hypothetical protein [Deltaproteobacteria bacterium]
MESELRARVPFLAWPVQWSHPAYGLMWFTDEPGAIVTQCLVERATPGAIGALHDFLDETVRLGLFEGRTDVVIVHDWRSIRVIDPGCRAEWLRRTQRPNKPFANIAASYVAVQLTGVLRMAVQTGALAVQLATGQQPVKIIDDPLEALAQCRIRAPARDLYDSLRRASGRFKLPRTP